jgi:hypothetical protein
VAITYTDGMALLTIFQVPRGREFWRRGERKDSEPPATQDGKPVVEHRSHRGLEWLKVTLGDTTVTLMGHGPVDALTSVITSMRVSQK